MKMTKCERVENSVCVSEAWSEFSEFSEVRHTFTFHVNKRPLLAVNTEMSAPLAFPFPLCAARPRTLPKRANAKCRQTAPQRFAFAAASRPGGTG